MSSTVRKYLALVLLVLACTSAQGEPPPRILQEPLLGLQYDRERVKFEPLPAKLASACHALNDSEEISGVWFVFAKASDASGRTYYLLNGYDVDRKPISPDQQYTAGGFGFILGVNGDKCEVLDGDARQLFSARAFDNEFPFDMMQRLAADFAARLVKAYGGADSLQRELVKQRISVDAQPEEVRHALRDIRTARQ
jgi:hypothetical protein